MEFVDERSLLELIEKYPGLSAWGIASPERYDGFGVDLDGSRRDLQKSFREFHLCCLWLSKCSKTRTATLSSPSSYSLKGKVERYFRENVSNGAFIAAALFQEIPVFISDQTSNVYVGVSRECPYFKEKSPGEAPSDASG